MCQQACGKFTESRMDAILPDLKVSTQIPNMTEVVHGVMKLGPRCKQPR